MDDSNPLEVSEAPRVIAGFWRRVFGVFIDSLILGGCDLFLGFWFSEVFMQMGPWGRIVGFLGSGGLCAHLLPQWRNPSGRYPQMINEPRSALPVV
jgi:hypothetical protein